MITPLKIRRCRTNSNTQLTRCRHGNAAKSVSTSSDAFTGTRQVRWTGAGQPTSSLDNNKQLPPIGPEIKVAFSVQAIIPGRAWLRSDNGEALTVAEGDTIKGFGRVTKIDPYDGIVEVNTGNKVVSLSYGNGAES